MQLLDAILKDSLVGQSQTTFPENPDNVFLILEFKVTPRMNFNWYFENALLLSAGIEYTPVLGSHEYGSGGVLTAFKLIYEVPMSSEFGACLVQFQDQNIELTPFFE